ncbi:arginine N-succinyltransferase [Chitinimonas arctica]|uniref:Arginine N-succinyltransferase n=1 Tax=Chitinimonas arctica TaxID=2594795 RepID=A0A516SAF1_9NEIS|nr:arginine N-succinyltransferase [Chitinimonas arctica]QDQ25124.1 arginine N-succinyltransferase [Chitinimonas arctica]
MFVLRSSRMSDLPGVELLARESPVGVTSLPESRDTLAGKIQSSIDSLAADIGFHGEESYFFVQEDTDSGELVGVSAIVASAGFNEPFYSYRNETFIHASPGLGIHNKIHALSLCHDLTGNTLLASFHVRPALRFSRWSDLQSRARLLFIAQWPERFADSVVSEMMGVTRPDGSSPFWDSVGRRFFGIDYQDVEYHCGVNGRKFIAELMPHHPLYVPLLADDAQAAMGQVNPDSEVPYEVLTREGFEAENYIDIFDGGPTLHCATRAIRSVAQSRLVQVAAGEGGQGDWLLATTRRDDFRATVVTAAADGERITLSREVLDRLGLSVGDLVRIAPL